MGWAGRAPASTARKAGKGATTTRSTPVPQAHFGIAVLAGLRRQAAIAKCKAWTDPIHTKSVHVKWPAKLASTLTAESIG